MRISIREGMKDIIEFSQIFFSGGEAAEGYAFIITLRGTRKECNPAVSVFDFRLSISLSYPCKPLLLDIPSAQQLIQCSNYPGDNEQLSFEFILSKSQANAIEDNRQEGDLKLALGLKAITVSNSGLQSSYDIQDISVPREQWLNALRNAGFRQTLLYEVPLPAVSKDLVVILSKAQEFIETGHYKDVVMQCRHIIEQIEKFRDDKRQSSAANAKAHSKERQDMSSIERLLSLREQLKNVCQLGAHGSENFSRSQAKAVLGMTLALLAEPTVGFGMTEEKGVKIEPTV